MNQKYESKFLDNKQKQSILSQNLKTDVFINTFIKNNHTSIIRITDNKYKEMYITAGDYIIVNYATTPMDGDRVLVSVNGKLLIKIFRKLDDLEYVVGDSHNHSCFLPLSVGDFNMEVIAVIIGVINDRTE